MLPDDPRHGTYAGYAAHYSDGVELCEPCRRIGRRVRKRNAYLTLAGRPATVPAIGTVRRLQALRAIGWNITDISRESGIPEKSLRNPTFRGTTVYRSTAERVAETYERLCMTFPEGGYADRCRNNARRMGWAPPLAWDNIDDPNEHPRTDALDGDDLDPVVVERILAGDYRLKATPAERVEVVARWPRSLAELARLTGWRVERYKTKEAVA